MEISKEHSELVEKVSNHMQFVGYETSISKDDPRDILARHHKKMNFYIRVFPTAIRFLAFFPFSEQTLGQRLERLEYVNSVNFESIAVQYSINEDDDVVAQLFMFAPYEKVVYAHFLDIWDEEMVRLINHKDTSKFLG